MNILCAVDGSERSEWAINTLGILFHQSVKDVCLLHVIDTIHLRQSLKQESADPTQLQAAIQSMESEAKRVLKTFKEKAILAISQSVTNPFSSVRSVVARGHVADTILKQAEKRKPDVIIIGSRGINDLRGYLLGSVSRKILTHASPSILTVKAPLPSTPRVLLAMDGSKSSKLVLKRLKSWNLPETVSFHVLSVVPPLLTDIAHTVFPKRRIRSLTAPLQDRAQHIAKQYREWLLKEGYEVSAEVREGNPRDVIVDTLQQKKMDLVVLGSKGLAGMERFQMGSVSEWVAAYAPCSVLVIKPSSHS